ncbi:hypothetical protein FRX31_016403, partial [Thalictrum thalictroides]
RLQNRSSNNNGEKNISISSNVVIKNSSCHHVNLKPPEYIVGEFDLQVEAIVMDLVVVDSVVVGLVVELLLREKE